MITDGTLPTVVFSLTASIVLFLLLLVTAGLPAPACAAPHSLRAAPGSTGQDALPLPGALPAHIFGITAQGAHLHTHSMS